MKILFRTYIKFALIGFCVALLAAMLASCASMQSLKKPASADKSISKTEKSDGDTAAGKILAQPNFKISKNTASAYDQALQHMRSKNYDNAILEMHNVAKMDERISGPWVNIGVAQKQLGETEEAKIAFEKALTINPENPYALNQLAILKREEGEFDVAEKLYLQALSAYPDYKNAHLNLAILCDVYLKKMDCALSHYQEYLSLSGGQDKQVIAWMSQLKKQGS